jgi:type I restriction-modification system DNA methylase subunit
MLFQPVVKELSFKPKSRPGTLNIIPSLEHCQIRTPPELAEFVWMLVKKNRKNVGSVVDFGAGNGIFALAGNYESYTGYEIDSSKYETLALPYNVTMLDKCILHSYGKFDLSIGNPPFIRHQDVADAWKKDARELIFRETGIKVDGLGNLYQYFMWLSLLRTNDGGIVALIVPFEWTFRQSAIKLRKYIKENGWRTTVIRLPQRYFFKNIAAVPSITIVDKERRGDGIEVYGVDKSLKINSIRRSPIDLNEYLEYSRKNYIVYAQRGFSTGSQEFFVLTEKERVANGIKRAEVVPCVTSLRKLSLDDEILDGTLFKSEYVNRGHKCWLVKTDGDILSENLRKYLEKVPEGTRENWTCKNRDVWYYYRTPKAPAILYACSFKNGKRPKMLKNDIKARNISAVHGIFVNESLISIDSILAKLRKMNFLKGTVPTINDIRKIEVGQMNGILNRLIPSTEDGGKRNGNNKS